MQMYMMAGTPQKWKIKRSCVSFPTLALLMHSLSFCLFGRGKKNPPNSPLKSFYCLHLFLSQIWTRGGLKTEGSERRCSGTHPHILTGTWLKMWALSSHRTAEHPCCYIRAKSLPWGEQCCSFRILIKRARSHVKGGFLHADIMGNFYLPLYHLSKVNIIRSCK